MSGLILLVIVGAWLAVLVPMALRSHDTGRALATVDAFRDAMRVLARRDPLPSEGAAASVEPLRRPAPGQRLLFDDLDGSGGVVTARSGQDWGQEWDQEPGQGSSRRSGRVTMWRSLPALLARQVGAATVAQRRRVLLVLVAAALVLLVAGLLGPRLLLAPQVLVDLLVVAYLVQLRGQTVRQARRQTVRQTLPARRQAEARTRSSDARGATRPVPERTAAPTSVRLSVPARVAGIPDRMPGRVGPLEVVPAVPGVVVVSAVVAAAAVSAVTSAEELPPPVRGAQGEPWQPVPVPLPGYVTAPTAPRRVLDLTRPGQRSDGVAAAGREPGIDDDGPDLDEILERRRASGGW